MKKRQKKKGKGKRKQDIKQNKIFLCLSNLKAALLIYFVRNMKQISDGAGKEEPVHRKCSSYRGDVATVLSLCSAVLNVSQNYKLYIPCTTQTRVQEHGENGMLSYLALM